MSGTSGQAKPRCCSICALHCVAGKHEWQSEAGFSPELVCALAGLHFVQTMSSSPLCLSTLHQLAADPVQAPPQTQTNLETLRQYISYVPKARPFAGAFTARPVSTDESGAACTIEGVAVGAYKPQRGLQASGNLVAEAF